MSIRIGLSSPIVVQVPGVSSPWEAGGTPEDLAAIAHTADVCGLEFLTCSEHIAVPTGEAATRGMVYWDPLSTLGYLAAHTRRIRLTTAVLVLGYHHPLEIAKRYGTLDLLAAGRVILGVGIGSLSEEFDLIGASWSQRAARADDALGALRAALGSAEPEYSGRFYSFGGMTVQPHAPRTQLPMWIGGRSEASLRRAIRLADGWMPYGLAPDRIRSMLNEHAPAGAFEIVLGTGRPLNPSDDPDGTRRALANLTAAGATVVSCHLAARSAEDYCAQIARLAEIASDMETPGDG